MSKHTKFNLNEMMAGNGEGLCLPPAFVFVNPKSQRKYKKSNENKVDGRTKGAKKLVSRILGKRKMKEELELISEKVPSATERAQEQIRKKKELDNKKDLQKKREEAREKMQRKQSEMDQLMKARVADFKNKANQQQKKIQKNSYEMEGNIMIEETDALNVALQVATSELDSRGETSFAKITFNDGSQQNLDNFSAKRIAAAYAQLDDSNKDAFRYMLNKDASTFQSALEFAVRNV
jgi:hypothetical protein